LPGGYTAYLNVYEKENSNYDHIYNKFAYRKWVTANVNSEHRGVTLPKKAKVVCVNRITTKGLSDSGSSAEINVSLSGSNFSNVIKDSWPTTASECRVPGDFEANGIYVDTCAIRKDGGGININGLCTLLMDSDYTLGLDIIEADAHSYEFSSSTFSNNLFPDAKLPSYNMKVFVKQAESTPETVKKDVCWTISTGVEASAGVKHEGDPDSPLELAVSASADVSVKSCSHWTDVPGGYTVWLSVFDQKDPNFAVAYGLVPEFDY